MDTVIAMALIAATNPVRLGIALLLISRSRPVLNLLAFWLGAMATAITAGVGVLTVVHSFAPTLMQSVSALSATPDARHTQIAIGLVILAITALVAVSSSVRPTRVTSASVDRRAGLPRPNTPSTLARLRGRIRDVLTSDGLSVAFVLGLGSGFPAVEYPIALAAIAASGNSVGVQFSAAVMFTVVMLLVIEIPLVSYSASPAQTQAVMQRIHDWVLPHRWQLLAVVVAAEAVWMVAAGLGGA